MFVKHFWVGLYLDQYTIVNVLGYVLPFTLQQSFGQINIWLSFNITHLWFKQHFEIVRDIWGSWVAWQHGIGWPELPPIIPALNISYVQEPNCSSTNYLIHIFYCGVCIELGDWLAWLQHSAFILIWPSNHFMFHTIEMVILVVLECLRIIPCNWFNLEIMKHVWKFLLIHYILETRLSRI